MAEAQKDTIYIDLDDEITTIIDKIQNSSSKVVALVLPKRATALQSIVNMKLLKRAGEQAKKNLVLITTESSLMPLAGAVGMHVASTPNSRPEIPSGPAAASQADDEIDFEDEIAPAVSVATAGNKPVGELAAATMPVPAKPSSDSGVETLELDNTDAPLAASAVAAAKKPKAKKNKKLAVPDFNRFRVLLALGGVLLVLLIVGGYFAFAVLPKATIDIKTNASNVNTDVDFTLSTSATSFNEGSKTVPAMRVQTQKTLTGSAPATGQKNNGDKASGSVMMTAGSCSANVPSDVSSGSALSSGGKTYVTQSRTQFVPAINKGKCTYVANGATDIKAQASGAASNTGQGATFTVSGRPDLSATGSATGGTDDLQTVISQSDIDAAKAKIASNSTNDISDELKNQLEDDNKFAITSTFAAGEPASSANAQVGDETSSVTVTQTITYTMLGANLSDIKTLVDNDIEAQIDTSNQGILNQGITQNAFKVVNATASGAAMNVQTTAVVGPSLNTENIAKAAAGKKSAEIESEVSANTGVTEVQVKMSPFWVSKAPKNIKKITVTIAKPTNTANGN